jgi:hypothetical protein
VWRSRYHAQLSRFLEHYPMERVLLLEQDELLNDRQATLERVFAFLGARQGVWRESFNEPRLETSARRRRTRLGVYAANRLPVRYWRKIRDRRPFSKPFEQEPMPDDLRTELEDLLRDDVVAFRELTGREFASWSV